MTRRQARSLFTVAAVWNLAAAAGALLTPELHRSLFFGSAVEELGSVARLNTQAFWVSVLLFGIGYGIVARDPDRNHGIVLLAALGKTYVFLAWFRYWLAGEVTGFALMGGIGDLVFAALFAWFLLGARRSATDG